MAVVSGNAGTLNYPYNPMSLYGRPDTQVYLGGPEMAEPELRGVCSAFN